MTIMWRSPCVCLPSSHLCFPTFLRWEITHLLNLSCSGPSSSSETKTLKTNQGHNYVMYTHKYRSSILFYIDNNSDDYNSTNIYIKYICLY